MRYDSSGRYDPSGQEELKKLNLQISRQLDAIAQEKEFNSDLKIYEKGLKADLRYSEITIREHRPSKSNGRRPKSSNSREPSLDQRYRSALRPFERAL